MLSSSVSRAAALFGTIGGLCALGLQQVVYHAPPGPAALLNVCLLLPGLALAYALGRISGWLPVVIPERAWVSAAGWTLLACPYPLVPLSWAIAQRHEWLPLTVDAALGDPTYLLIALLSGLFLSLVWTAWVLHRVVRTVRGQDVSANVERLRQVVILLFFLTAGVSFFSNPVAGVQYLQWVPATLAPVLFCAACGAGLVVSTERFTVVPRGV